VGRDLKRERWGGGTVWIAVGKHWGVPWVGTGEYCGYRLESTVGRHWGVPWVGFEYRGQVVRSTVGRYWGVPCIGTGEYSG
jgi:hypothetical protein